MAKHHYSADSARNFHPLSLTTASAGAASPTTAGHGRPSASIAARPAPSVPLRRAGVAAKSIAHS
jgi:hypothetical protein